MECKTHTFFLLAIFSLVACFCCLNAEEITTDLGQGVFDEWLAFFHREIDRALSVVEKTKVSKSCGNNLISYLRGLKAYKPWAVQMWDSMESFPAGILRGNVLFWPGSYGECVNVQPSEFKSQYCLVQVEINEQRNEIGKLFDSNETVKVGVCLPLPCTTKEISLFLYNYLGPNVSANESISCQTSMSGDLDSSAVAIIFVLSIFGVLLVVGTLLEVVPIFQSNQGTEDNETPSEKPKNLLTSGLTSFSALSNTFSLFATDQKGGIGSLHGLRFLSMAWIILLHVFSSSLPLSWNNLYDVVDLQHDLLAQIILNGNIAVDTFYCMSGLLVSYVFFKKITKTKEFSFVEYYIHRYIRLTPVYAIVIGIAAGLFPYFGSGPRWPEIVQMSQNCKDNWWLNLLYVSNIFNTGTMCQPHCWFLATDIQLYIFAPIVLYPLYKNMYIGGAIAAIIGVTCILADALITYFFDLPATSIIFEADSGLKQIEYFQKIYMIPYIRGGPYVIGIITGYILSRQNEAPLFFNKKVAAFGWIVTTVCNLSVLFGFYKFISSYTIPSLAERCLYSALSRTGWAAGIAWIILACKWGYGGPVNSILSLSIFIVLGKLTYCAYILHYNIVLMFYYSRQSTMYYDFWMAIFIYLGILVVSFALAIPFTLLFELPILKLEKMITARKATKSILDDDKKNYASTQDVGGEMTREMRGIANAAFDG